MPNPITRECKSPYHKGNRWLPLRRFHKHGKKWIGGKHVQMYNSRCDDCENMAYRKEYRDKKVNQDSKKAYSRARSRTLTRIAHLVPELYYDVLEEELAKEPDYKPYEKDESS